MRKTKSGYGCSGYPNCSFGIWGSIAGKTITENQAKVLCTKGETGVLKGFQSKEGKSFDAALALADGKVTFKLPQSEDLDFNCPECGSPMRKTRMGFGCSGYPDCKFIIWDTIAGKTITKKIAKELCIKKKTDVIDGFTSKSGSSFNASLEIKDGKVSFCFD